jgi:hypothetical protein
MSLQMRKHFFYLLLISIIISCEPKSDGVNFSMDNYKTTNTDTAKVSAGKALNQVNSALRPVDDFTHVEAIVMAKEFVVRKLNISPAPTFDNTNLDWIKLQHNVYKITSVVDADDANCIRHRYNWMVKLKYKNGDWTDKNNWTVVDIQITK